MTKEEFLARIGPPGSLPTGLPVVLELGCREYLGNYARYAMVECFGKKQGAHRHAYVFAKGPISSERPIVMHLCNNPRCCEPTHLQAGTYKENAEYSRLCGRAPIGERHWSRKHPDRIPRGERNGARKHPECVVRGVQHGKSKLNEARVEWARRRYSLGGITQTKIASILAMSQGLISKIINREIWTHI